MERILRNTAGETFQCLVELPDRRGMAI